jgi:hypothetical protein
MLRTDKEQVYSHVDGDDAVAFELDCVRCSSFLAAALAYTARLANSFCIRIATFIASMMHESPACDF